MRKPKSITINDETFKNVKQRLKKAGKHKSGIIVFINKNLEMILP